MWTSEFAEYLQVLKNGEVLVKDIMLRTHSNVISNGLHISPDVVSKYVSVSFGGFKHTN